MPLVLGFFLAMLLALIGTPSMRGSIRWRFSFFERTFDKAVRLKSRTGLCRDSETFPVKGVTTFAAGTNGYPA